MPGSSGSEARSARQRTLNATSYVVLGMLSYGPATSYDLKQRVSPTIGNFWMFAHSQLYDEPARLVEDGLARETREAGGRRRRTYEITEEGTRALREWLAAPTPDEVEVRDPGLLKLFFCSMAQPEDVHQLAVDQLRSHRNRANGYQTRYEEVRRDAGADQFHVASLRLGLRYERCVEEFWADYLATLDSPADGPRSDG